MGKGTSSAQQAPEQGVSPEVAPEVVVPENALMAAQQLSGGGNAWVQEQMKAQLGGDGAAQAQATQDAAQSLNTALDGGDVQEAAPEIEAALEEGEAAAEGLEEGGGITSETPPGDGATGGDDPAATEGPSVEGPAEAAAVPAEGGAAEATHAETSGATTRDDEKKEFARVYRSTSASETDAWLDGLEAREATNPALVGLTAELRALVKQRREERAAKKQAAKTPAAPTTPTTAPVTPEAEEGVWAWLASAKQTVVEGWDALKSWWTGVKTSVAEGWAWITSWGDQQGEQALGKEQAAGEQALTLPTGAQAYDEATAQAFMDQMYEAYTTVPISFDVDGATVSVQVQAKYRNFGTDSDWKGALSASESAHGKGARWDFKRMLTTGKASDKVKHSEGFAQSYAGKASPDELREGVQEAVDADADLQAQLAEAYKTGEAEAKKVLEAWCQRRLGLDCIGFAWNLINGSRMYDQFTPGTKGVWDTELEKEENIACSGFMKFAKNIHDTPKSWRALDCLVDSGHILVIYRVTELVGGVREVELMQSSGSKGVNRVTYFFGKGKKKGGALESEPSWYTDQGLTSSVGHRYEVFRPENSDAHQATLDG